MANNGFFLYNPTENVYFCRDYNGSSSVEDATIYYNVSDMVVDIHRFYLIDWKSFVVITM